MSEEPSRRIIGAAQSPSQVYEVVRRHPVGHRVARAIAARHGVVVGPDVRIMRVSDKKPLAGTNAHASYFSRELTPGAMVHWTDLFEDHRIFVWMHRSVFLSDESIVAHLTHELFEVEGLRLAFAEANLRMTSFDLHQLIRAGKVGNLHDLAWEASNAAVEAMRSRRSKP